MSIRRNIEAQALDDAKVLTVPGYQREALLYRGRCNKRIEDV